MGNVAATAHQSGSVTSATSPNPAKVSQNIFFCMFRAYFESRQFHLAFAIVNCKNKKSGTRYQSRPAFSFVTGTASRFLVYGSRRVRRF